MAHSPNSNIYNYLSAMFRKREDTLKSVMQKMVAHYRLKPNLDRIAVEKFWKDEMGALVNRYTEKIYFSKKGSLMIKVSSAPLKNELFINRANLIERINAYLGSNTIKELRIV